MSTPNDGAAPAAVPAEEQQIDPQELAEAEKYYGKENFVKSVE